MKIAVIYNRESQRVINLFGIPNRERLGFKVIRRIVDALRQGGHQVTTLEGDKDLIANLESFMPRVLKGERPGMVFNLSYGIQGQARYTHVPSILEMVGIPYIGSGPLAHSLALDKVVTKMILRQLGLPTPPFVIAADPDFQPPQLTYPLIVKPKNEAVSLGVRVVRNEPDLREAVESIVGSFGQPALIEKYIEGREINVGLLGNAPVEALPPVEIVIRGEGPNVYTYDDKRHASGREILLRCPAPLGPSVTEQAQDLAQRAFTGLGCYDCGRVDLRLDHAGKLNLLEVNSLPSLGESSSYVAAAAEGGLGFTALVNRLVEVASARYFGTPTPPPLVRTALSPDEAVFRYLTERRERLERRLRHWTMLSSRTTDLVGLQGAIKEAGKVLQAVKLSPVDALADNRSVWTWETEAGLDDGTLLLAHLDVPLTNGQPAQAFRKDPEWLGGEGVGTSRAPLVMLEFALRAVHSTRLLKRIRLGVLLYADEGYGCRYSAKLIQEAAERASRVIVLRPASEPNRLVTERRGQRTYRFSVEGTPRRVDKNVHQPDAFRWGSALLTEFAALSSSEKRLSLAAVEVHTSGSPLLLPHRLEAAIVMTYMDPIVADSIEQEMRQRIPRNRFQCELELVSDRPPLRKRAPSTALAEEFASIASSWDMPLAEQSSAWPSVAGLVPDTRPVVCGLGPVTKEMYTPQEAISRISFVQRTLLLSQFLLTQQ